MTSRRFPVQDGAQVIACGVPGCNTTCATARSGGKAGGNLPPEAVVRFFVHKGWRVGQTARKDRCPAHAKPQRQPREEPPQMAADPKIAHLNPPKPGASEEPPREMGRDDRRLIFAKLEEVYIDENNGYSKGWNDEAVAKDMAVPRAWVALIREENFGPQKAEQSAEIIDLKQRIDRLEVEAKDLHRSADQMHREGKVLVDAAIVLHSDSERLLKSAETLRSEVKRMTGAR